MHSTSDVFQAQPQNITFPTTTPLVSSPQALSRRASMNKQYEDYQIMQMEHTCSAMAPYLRVVSEGVNHALPHIQAHAALQPHTLDAHLQQVGLCASGRVQVGG